MTSKKPSTPPRTFAESRMEAAAQDAPTEKETERALREAEKQEAPDTSVCSTCGEEAVFVDDNPSVNPVGYCGAHIPAHLRDKAKNE